MLTTSFLRQLEQILSRQTRKKMHFRRVKPIEGGNINLTARLDTTVGTYFLKSNDAFRFPAMFEKEVRGLEALRKAEAFTIPEVILTGDAEGQAFLILKFFEDKDMKSDFWESFGKSLAKLHKVYSPKYGFSEDNYMGSLEQSNKEHNKWIDFFVEERLEKQLKRAMELGYLNGDDENGFQKLYRELDSLIPNEPSSLLHGDLWGGNFITGESGEPCLIDPAVYYGHREMDLSMTRLFEGFDEPFYETYNSEYPLAPGFESRVDIHNLYPLLVHVNLFGGGYIPQLRGILKKFR
jgi:fructosamine-3-kinase